MSRYPQKDRANARGKQRRDNRLTLRDDTAVDHARPIRMELSPRMAKVVEDALDREIERRRREVKRK